MCLVFHSPPSCLFEMVPFPVSGCGGGAPHPIVTPHPWLAACARGVVQISGSVITLLYAAGTGFDAV